MTYTRYGCCSSVPLQDVQGGLKLTDNAIVPILRMMRNATGVEFLEPAVLQSFLFPDSVVPDISLWAKSLCPPWTQRRGWTLGSLYLQESLRSHLRFLEPHGNLSTVTGRGSKVVWL